MAMKSTFSQDVADEIVSKLADGVPLTVICRGDGMPDRGTVRNWRKDNRAFDESIKQARDDGHDALADQCLDIADDERQDWVLSKKGAVVDETAIARSKLRVWTRMQLLSKWDPKRYGEKLDLNHSGSIGVAGALKAARDARKAAK